MKRLTLHTDASVPHLHDILASANERLVLVLHHTHAPDTILCDIRLDQGDDALFEDIHDLAAQEDVVAVSVYQRVSAKSVPDMTIRDRTTPTHWRTIRLSRDMFLDWLSDWFDETFEDFAKHDNAIFLLVASTVMQTDILSLHLGRDVRLHRYHTRKDRALADIGDFLERGGHLENIQCVAYFEEDGIAVQERLRLRPSRVVFADTREI